MRQCHLDGAVRGVSLGHARVTAGAVDELIGRGSSAWSCQLAHGAGESLTVICCAYRSSGRCASGFDQFACLVFLLLLLLTKLSLRSSLWGASEHAREYQVQPRAAPPPTNISLRSGPRALHCGRPGLLWLPLGSRLPSPAPANHLPNSLRCPILSVHGPMAPPLLTVAATDRSPWSAPGGQSCEGLPLSPRTAQTQDSPLPSAVAPRACPPMFGYTHVLATILFPPSPPHPTSLNHKKCIVAGPTTDHAPLTHPETTTPAPMPRRPPPAPLEQRAAGNGRR